VLIILRMCRALPVSSCLIRAVCRTSNHQQFITLVMWLHVSHHESQTQRFG
jgi:hypothetical protein